jgi:peptidoglycan/LPS O-acetylase OafA/YrhL
MLLTALLDEAETRRSLYLRALTLRPLLFVGRVSYGLYVLHILVFTVLAGYLDIPIDKLHWGVAGNLLIIAVRLAAAIGAAALMWFYFEKPILGLKRKFQFA